MIDAPILSSPLKHHFRARGLCQLRNLRAREPRALRFLNSRLKRLTFGDRLTRTSIPCDATTGETFKETPHFQNS